jgi:hypothetical protein
LDQETRVLLEESFREVSRKIDGLGTELREEMSKALGGLREEVFEGMEGLREENRLTRVLVEGLRSDLQLTAEGLFGLSERMTNHEMEVQRSLNELKALIISPYQGLDCRVRVLEERADRQRRDVFEVLREKFGKRQSL